MDRDLGWLRKRYGKFPLVEQISSWDERDVPGLARAATELRDLEGTWRRWGQFRAIVLEVLTDTLPRAAR